MRWKPAALHWARQRRRPPPKLKLKVPEPVRAHPSTDRCFLPTRYARIPRDKHLKALIMVVIPESANSASSEPGSAPTALAGTAADGRRKVLLVEDHDLVRMGVKALFSGTDSASIDWIEASTLADALRQIGRASCRERV